MEKINKLDKSFTQLIAQLLFLGLQKFQKQKQPPDVFYNKDVLKIFGIFTGVGVFFNKVAGLRLANVLKKRLQHRRFPVNIAKLFKNTYFEEHLQTAASDITNSKT